ncbi:hypothetical protein HDV62DRAFT_367489 [Trichoderma sp. SZMC 28011]
MRGTMRERETCFVRLVHLALNIGDVDAREKCSTSAATYCANQYLRYFFSVFH